MSSIRHPSTTISPCRAIWRSPPGTPERGHGARRGGRGRPVAWDTRAGPRHAAWLPSGFPGPPPFLRSKVAQGVCQPRSARGFLRHRRPAAQLLSQQHSVSAADGVAEAGRQPKSLLPRDGAGEAGARQVAQRRRHAARIAAQGWLPAPAFPGYRASCLDWRGLASGGSWSCMKTYRPVSGLGSMMS